MNSKKMLLINGSPRKKGTSNSFAEALRQLTEETQGTAQVVHAIDYLDGKADVSDLIKTMQDTDLIGISCPLYIDTLPYPMLWLFETLESCCPNGLQGKGLFAVIQSGFPVNALMRHAIESCRFFGEAMGCRWLGGLAYGGGAMINGADLQTLGKKGTRMLQALRRAVQELSNGEPISAQCQQEFSRDFPKGLYRPMAFLLNTYSKKEGRKHGHSVQGLIRKVYLE